MHVRFIAYYLVAATVSVASMAIADEEQARAYLNAASEDIKSGNYDSVERSLELMQEQFEGVPDTVKTKLLAQGEALKKQAVEKKAESLFVEADKELTKLEKDKDLKRVLANAQAKPTDADALGDLGGFEVGYMQFTENHLKALPAGSPRTKALSDRLDRWAAPANKLLMASQRQKNVDAIKGVLEQVKAGVANAVKDPAQPDFATWAQGSEDVTAKGNLNLAAGIYEYLNEPNNKAVAGAFADDAEIAGMFKQMRATADAAAARVITDTAKAVKAAETAPPNQWDVPGRLKRVRDRLATLNGAAGRDELDARIGKLLDRWEKGESEQMAAHAKAIGDLEASAKTQWPAMLAQYASKCVEIDPADALADIAKYKGKLVRFQDKANVGGTQYGGPDFAYVVTIDGKPFACKLSKKGLAVADKYAKWNEHRPISLNDFRDVVARVVGTGRLNVLSKNTVTDEYEVIGQTDAPVAEIVAFQSVYVSFDETKGSNVDSLK